ncbi:MAG: DUF366 family protein [Planctomycetota bacterium]|nr:DUF366 family protein [Planctomycetota bacterium]
MITVFLEDPLDYDGIALQSLWAYRTLGTQGNSLVSFIGGCDFPFENMADLEDVRAEKRIWSPRMLHFIEERFDMDLEKAILRQRLLAILVKEAVSSHSSRSIRREGDDLFDEDRKLSISIATVTPVSTKIHFGINVDRAEGLDVQTEGLSTYGIDPRVVAEAVLQRYPEEMESVEDARTRVRGLS